MHVEELMHVNSEIPLVKPDTVMRDTILEMTGKRLGCTAVIDDKGRLIGIFTDGDLRRLAQQDEHFYARTVEEVMIRNPKTISPGEILDKALAVMEKHSITVLPVVDDSHHPIGIIHLHDILRSKLV
ncbi:MAG: CBS domain-containing protein, partial [Candidatus Zixiibacteriota bacterium]